MKRLLVMLLLVGACNTKPEVPKDVLPPYKMQAIMYDLIQVDGLLANMPMNDSVARRNEERYMKYQQVLSLHGTNKKAFVQSLKYYESNPSMFKVVLDSLDKKAAVSPPAYAKDSVNRRPLPF